MLAELRAAWHHTAGSERERVFGLLAETYYAAGQLAWKLGYTDLASISVDRYEWAAERSGDELAVLVGMYRRAGELICLDDCAAAQRLLDDARCRIENRLGRSAAPPWPPGATCTSNPGSPRPGLVIAPGRTLTWLKPGRPPRGSGPTVTITGCALVPPTSTSGRWVSPWK